MARSPEQMRLMLIDPKIVEFSGYNSLPHLVVPVITDPKKVALGLRWAINEMEKRYKLFAKVGVRNIKASTAVRSSSRRSCSRIRSWRRSRWRRRTRFPTACPTL
jgi:DNA segregation ATPase FtsK/SpoIIIE-like protein